MTEKYTIEAVAGSAAGDAASMTLLPGVPPFKQPDAVRANAATMSGPMLLARLERRFGLKAHIVTEQAQAFSLLVAPRDPDLRIATDPSSVQPAPDLFTALERQLGLRLEPEPVPRDDIVIDAIKRPDPN